MGNREESYFLKSLIFGDLLLQPSSSCTNELLVVKAPMYAGGAETVVGLSARIGALALEPLTSVRSPKDLDGIVSLHEQVIGYTHRGDEKKKTAPSTTRSGHRANIR